MGESSLIWLRVAAGLYSLGLLDAIITVLRRRESLFRLALGAFGISFMGPLAERCITILGSTLVITAHGLNRTFCKYCDSCNSDDEARECGD